MSKLYSQNSNPKKISIKNIIKLKSTFFFCFTAHGIREVSNVNENRSKINKISTFIDAVGAHIDVKGN